MKKVMMLAALLAMLIVAAIPAIAQVEQGLDQEAESGALEQSSTSTNEGDNSIQCVGDQLLGNTGNNQSQTGLLQYQSSGSATGGSNTLEVASEFDDEADLVECTAEINQAAAAG